MTQSDVREERLHVVAEARSWIGTPYHHGQAVKGVGVDCAQLLVTVFQMLRLVDVPRIEFYAEDWFLHERRERLVEILETCCVRTEHPPRSGDVVTFRFGRAISHAGIVTTWPYMVHSERMIGRVYEDRCDVHDTLASRYCGAWTLHRWAQREGRLV